MAASQRRWLTAPTSRLGSESCDLAVGCTALRKDDAWSTLPLAVREHLYGLLPPPEAGEPAHDINVHPLKSAFRAQIEKALRRWKDDLADGREVKKWRQEAIQAGRDRAEGKWESLKLQQRNEYWSQAPQQPSLDGCSEGSESQHDIDDRKKTSTD